MFKDLFKKYGIPFLVGAGVVSAMAIGLLCHHPSPSTNAGFSPTPGDTSSTQVTVTNNTVQIEHGERVAKIPKHHNSVVSIYNPPPDRPVKPSGGKPFSPSTTIVVGGNPTTVIHVKNWGPIFQGQLEGGFSAHLKPLAGFRAKMFYFHGFGLGAGINTSGFNLVDISHELPKLSMVDATAGISHTTFEAEKEIIIKASFSVNLW